MDDEPGTPAMSWHIAPDDLGHLATACHDDAMTPKLCIAQNPEADALLQESPLALLIGMLLDQHVV